MQNMISDHEKLGDNARALCETVRQLIGSSVVFKQESTKYM